MNKLEIFDELFIAKSDMEYEAKLLYQYTKDLKANSILELGTGFLKSTTAFLLALEQTDGKIVSVDVEKIILEERRDPRNYRVMDFWIKYGIQYKERLKLVQIHSEDYNLEKEDWIQFPLDILFIDTSHTLVQTLCELVKFSPYVKDSGIILLHDTLTKTGVLEAIQLFIKQPPFLWEYIEISHPMSQTGLGLLTKNKRK